MSTAIEPLHPEELMAELEYDATYCQPRLFAIYGVSHNKSSPPILGWGLEFPEGESAIFYSPESRVFWRSSSAEHLLQRHQQISDARLKWLDEAEA